MAKVRLTGEAARKWLAENPQGSYTNARTGQLVDRTSGAGKLALGITKPFRQGAGIAEEFGYTLGDIVNMLGGKKQTKRPDKYALLNEEESKQLYEDPLKTGLKAGAGVASYGIGGGGIGGAVKGGSALARIGSAAKLGSIGGGLGGLGYSEEGKELEGILKGGALGGVLGGGLQAVGEGVGRLSRAKKGLGQVGEMDLESLPKGVRSGLKNQAKAAGIWDNSLSDTENLSMFVQNRKYAGNTPRETLENITKVVKEGKTLKGTGLDEIGNVGDDVLQTARQNFQSSVAKGGFSKTGAGKSFADVDDVLSGKAGIYSAKDLDLTIMKWEEAGRKASGVGKSGAASAYTEGAGALRDALRGLPTATKYNEGLELLSSAYGVEKFGSVSKAAQNIQKTGVHPPFTQSANISMAPVAEKASKVRAGLGRLQEGFAPQLGEATGQIPGAFSLGQRAIPGIVGMQGQAPEQEPMETQGMSEQATQPQYSFQDAIAEAYSYFPDASEAQIITVAKYLMDQKGGGDVDTGTIANVQQAIDMIDQYGTGAAGKISTITGKVGEFFGSASQGTTYRSLISDIRTKLIKQIAGTAQTPAEMKNLMDRLPQPTDEPAVAKAKLQVLLNSLQGGGAGNPSEESAVSDYESW